MLSPYPVIRSYMEPSEWLVITSPRYRTLKGYIPKNQRTPDDLPPNPANHGEDYPCWLWQNNTLTHFDRLTVACKACGNRVTGKNRRSLIQRGWRRFKNNGAVVFLEFNVLPQKLRDAIEASKEWKQNERVDEERD